MGAQTSAFALVFNEGFGARTYASNCERSERVNGVPVSVTVSERSL